MKLFLTSSPGCVNFNSTPPVSCPMDTSNGLVDRLRALWPTDAVVLVMSSSPDEPDRNDFFAALQKESLHLTGLSCASITVCDRRNARDAAEFVASSSVIFLSGGHVPTENRFFSEIGLAALLKGYNGIIIGISAGSMNSADIVYAQPELKGEVANCGYARYLTGLGLTDISVLPHFQELRDMTLDEVSILDISLEDSKKRPFYALVDGSYIYSDGNIQTLFGEGYLFSGGQYKKVCGFGETLDIGNQKH